MLTLSVGAEDGKSKKEIRLAADFQVLQDSAVFYVSTDVSLVEIELERTGGNKSFDGLILSKIVNGERIKLATFAEDGVLGVELKQGEYVLSVKDPDMDTVTQWNDVPQAFWEIQSWEMEFKGGHHIKLKGLVYQGPALIADKPIIYLYPEAETEVSVTLEPRGEISFTYPVYDNGWKVTATPEGVLKMGDRNFYYLFWEGKYTRPLLTSADEKQGFVVKGKDTQAFFEETLPKMGLTPTEYNEFIVYWTPLMQNNKYNFIHFKFNEDYDREIAGINVTPKPDNMFRLFMVYKPLFREIEVEPQPIPKANREGFTVIEWGGAKWEMTNSN